MNKKIALTLAIGSTLLLAGCSSGPDDQTMSQIKSLNGQIEQLNNEIATLKQDQSRTEMKATDAEILRTQQKRTSQLKKKR